jgi:predicted RNA-binding Zn-ribbon protein involved in translation (DUF1610 family)
MGKVVAFAPKQDAGITLNGRARCLGCKHEWIAVVPAGTVTELECPQCGAEKGLMRFPCERSESHWRCNCGNSYLLATPKHLYCPNCGVDQEPW